LSKRSRIIEEGEESEDEDDTVVEEETDDDEATGDEEDLVLGATSLATALGSRAVHMFIQGKGISRAAAEIAKSVPEAYEGEHAAGLQAMLNGDAEQAKVVAFKMLVYQVSNNLINDDDDDYDDDDAENKYERIVNLFREIGLPRETWEEHFAQKRDRSSKAFTEKLFEAAVNAQDLEVVEALLKTGFDPNQPIMSFMNCHFERPVQVAADSRVNNVELVRLLVSYGAKVDLSTSDQTRPALHAAAERGTLEMVQELVESGACIYLSHGSAHGMERVGGVPLRFAASRWQHSFESSFRPTPRTADDHDDTQPETEGAKVLRYLTGLHQTGTSQQQDKWCIQGALTVAADHADPCFLRILHEVGADVTKADRLGNTPLVVAASHYSGDTRVVSYLLERGAPVDEPSPRPSALHFAASRGSKKVVALLIDKGANVNTKAEITEIHERFLGENFNPPDGVVRGWYTPLQLALHRVGESCISPYSNTKTDEAAIALLEAGAQLVGGELVLGVRFLSRRLVGALLDRGACPSERDSTGCSALKMALRTYHLRGCRGESVSDILLEAGAVVDGTDIYLAFGAGDLKLASFLASKTRHLNGTGPDGESLLQAALGSRSRPMAVWALCNRRVPYSSGALCAGVLLHARGDRCILRKLLEKRRNGGFVPDPVLETTAVSMLAYYCAGKDASILVEILKDLQPQVGSCVIPFEDKYTNYISLPRGSWQRSLTKEYNVPDWWRKPELICCSPLLPLISQEVKGRWALMKLLMNVGYRPDALCMWMAIHNLTAGEVELMIRHGGGVNQEVRHDLDTPIQVAARLGRDDVVEVLLKHGAEVNGLPPVLVPLFSPGRDPSEFKPRSALQAAVEEGHLEIIDMLLAAGADVNGAISLDGGATALQCAAGKGFIGIAKTLIERGADINARRAERYGRTALEAAAEWGRLDMVQFLLEEGADTKSEDGVWQYLRAMRLAERNGHLIVAGLLRDWRVLDKWEKRCYWFEGLLDEVFVAPDDALLDELFADLAYAGYDSEEDDANEDESDEDGQGSEEFSDKARDVGTDDHVNTGTSDDQGSDLESIDTVGSE
jgi:ankyrin repeat protein